MIIDKTYFVEALNIPNLDLEENTDLISNNNNLDNVIARYSFIYLKDVFGYKIAKEILNVIKPNGEFVSGVDQKYVDLIDGDDASDWMGLRYSINGIKYSQIANFVYCNYLKEYENRMTDIGATVDNAEQGKGISSWYKFNHAWREMYGMRQPLNNVYEFVYYNDYWNPEDNKTLYEYIRDNSNWSTDKFVCYDNSNALGL